MEDFNLKKFLIENKLTANSKMLNEAEDAGAFVNTIFSTAKALGLVQMNMQDSMADERKWKEAFQKEGFPPNSHGILGVERIANGKVLGLLVMTDDKAKLEKLEDVITNSKGNFKPDANFTNTSRIYKIENPAKGQEAFVHAFTIDLTTPVNENEEEGMDFSTGNTILAVINHLIDNDRQDVLDVLQGIPQWNELVDQATDM